MENNGKWYFVDTVNNQVLDQVGDFGEVLASPILQSEIFSGKDSPLKTADLFNCDEGLATQAKMCNQKHSHRISPNQIENLYKEVTAGFRVCYGIYFLAFYKGTRESNENGVRKQFSIIKGNLSRIERAIILAKELQYVCVLDIRLIRFLVRRHPEFLKKSTVKDGRPHKEKDDIRLFLGRKRLMGFLTGKPLQKKLLYRAFAKGKKEEHLGAIKTSEIKIQFNGKENFERKIPIHIVGRRDTVNAVIRQLQISCSLTIGEQDEQLLLV